MAGAVLATAAVASAPAAAADAVKLKFADWLPLSHYTLEQGVNPWLKHIAEASGGTINVEYYPAQQLGKAKDMVTLAQAGVADIVHVSPAYISEKFPLSGVAELPGMFSNTCDGNKALMTMMKPGGFLDGKEFKPQKLRVLWAMTYAPYAIVTTNKPVTALADLEGLKMRTAGGAMDITAVQTGSVPIKMTGPDVLPSLQRGTLDGMFVTLLSLPPFDWQTALKYMTTNVSTASFVSVFAITERGWKKLSPDQQAMLAKVSDEAAERICAWVDKANKEIIHDLEKAGMKEVLMKDGEKVKLDEKLANTRAEWAKALDGMGKPGTETLKQFQSSL
jgi:TRAP-type C4-dicarboxylate transport system substrate-binding protein